MTFVFLIAIAVCLSFRGPALYRSDRIEKNNKIFKMLKFGLMKVDTPIVTIYLLDNPDECVSSISSFLRRFSLDEFPQLFSILKGDMSFERLRPTLCDQDNLIALRADKLLPGITGWAQVNGRDNLSIPNKVALDVEYLNHQSFWFDMKILWMTFLKVINQDGVSH